jgi:hypothetical protein
MYLFKVHYSLWSWLPNLRTPNTGFNTGFTPQFYITNVGMYPGLNPGFGVLRCGPRVVFCNLFQVPRVYLGCVLHRFKRVLSHFWVPIYRLGSPLIQACNFLTFLRAYIWAVLSNDPTVFFSHISACLYLGCVLHWSKRVFSHFCVPICGLYSPLNQVTGPGKRKWPGASFSCGSLNTKPPRSATCSTQYFTLLLSTFIVTKTVFF